jgi:1-acyl-sn-glycerol-3-phosphate acyltransferase
MPLGPLTNPPGHLGRSLLAVPFVAAGFGALLVLNVAQLGSLLLVPFSRPAYRRFNAALANLWWGGCVLTAEIVWGFRLVVTGDDVPGDENVLIVSNHQQMPDITTLMTWARSKGRLGDLKFFVKHALKWVPGIGWGMQFLSCPFLRRDWTRDRRRVEQTFHTLVAERIPMWLVSFAEGTRVTAAKLEASNEWAREQGLPTTRHVLLPRTKGFVATLEGLGTHLDAVYDVTIGYVDGVPTLWQFITGAVRRVHVHVRRFRRTDLPAEPDGQKAWLLDLFYTKDALLDGFYRTGAFPDADAATERLV